MSDKSVVALVFKQPDQKDPPCRTILGWMVGGFPGVSSDLGGNTILVLEPYIGTWTSRVRLSRQIAGGLGKSSVVVVCHKRTIGFMIKVFLFARDLRWWGVDVTVEVIRSTMPLPSEVRFRGEPGESQGEVLT